MSEQEQVAEQTQNAPQESVATPQEQQQPEVDTSKIFSKGYNEGKSKAERDFLNKFTSSLGIEEAESIDDVLNTLSGKLSPKKESESEVEQLRQLLEQANLKAQEAEDNYAAFVYESKLDTTMQGAIDSLSAEGNLSLKPDHLKNLFYMEYEIEERDGQFFPTRNSTPVLDQEGNRKSLSTVMRDFVRENKYITSRVQGTGGSSGDGSASSKPSRSEFRALLKGNAESQAKASELFNIAIRQGVGWAD